MQYQLPEDLLKSLEKVNGFDLDKFVEVHQNKEIVTSVRFNPFKLTSSQNTFLQISNQVPWCSNGYYLSERPSFTLDPLFHAGTYYVQEASSMFLEEVLKQTLNLDSSIRVLDLCAAPGGKSTLIQSLISGDSLLVSNEVIKSRVNILSENMTKWGAINVVVTNNDPKDFQRLPEFFDAIVVDAPCSGSGLFRKDSDAINEWSSDNVELCSQRQQRILADIIPSLKPGGILIYSTCSYSVQEDEDICDWLLSQDELESIQIQIQNQWDIVETNSDKFNGFGYRFYPDKLKGEGFFITSFRKKETTTSKQIKPKTKLEFIKKSQETAIADWINQSENLIYFTHNNNAIALHKTNIDYLLMLQQSLYLRKAGLNLGTIIRDGLLPSHDLAMSYLINKNVQSIELKKEEALNYLRHQPFEVETKYKGWVLIRYNEVALGFVKMMPNRINNYYPMEWRIFNK
jgi:NOL1/NOP2/sun family putative RNA methylase